MKLKDSSSSPLLSAQWAEPYLHHRLHEGLHITRDTMSVPRGCQKKLGSCGRSCAFLVPRYGASPHGPDPIPRCSFCTSRRRCPPDPHGVFARSRFSSFLASVLASWLCALLVCSTWPFAPSLGSLLEVAYLESQLALEHFIRSPWRCSRS